MNKIICFVALSLNLSAQAHAKGVFTDGDELLLQTSVWTRHYSEEPDHNNHQQLINAEWFFPERHSGKKALAPRWQDDIRWLAGVATFKNSYDQQSTYLYGGGRYDYGLAQHTDVYLKLTAGVLHGYRGEYEDKIPFNDLGMAPVVLPAIGLAHRRLNLEIVPFAAAGVMMNIGVYLR